MRGEEGEDLSCVLSVAWSSSDDPERGKQRLDKCVEQHVRNPENTKNRSMTPKFFPIGVAKHFSLSSRCSV